MIMDKMIKLQKRDAGVPPAPLRLFVAIVHAQSQLCGHKKNLSLSAFICGLIICGSGFADPIATVGQEQITADQVRVTAAKKGYSLHDEYSANQALTETITFELLAAEAEKLGYLDDPEIVQMAKSMAVQKLVAEKVDRQLKKTPLTEEQLKAYYDAHPEEFSKPTLAKGRVLMVLNREGARERFDEAVAKAQAGKAFDSIVQEYSDDASARANGGMSNWQIQGNETRRYPGQVLDALFALSDKGTISEPIITEKAFYLVQLEERRDGKVTDYETAKRTISRKLYTRARQDAYTAYVETLKGDISVKINQNALKEAMEKASAGDGPPSGPVRVRTAAHAQE